MTNRAVRLAHLQRYRWPRTSSMMICEFDSILWQTCPSPLRRAAPRALTRTSAPSVQLIFSSLTYSAPILGITRAFCGSEFQQPPRRSHCGPKSCRSTAHWVPVHVDSHSRAPLTSSLPLRVTGNSRTGGALGCWSGIMAATVRYGTARRSCLVSAPLPAHRRPCR